MPSIVDMGLAGVLNQPAPFSDPGILLSALALRERKRATKQDEEYRAAQAAEQTRQFDTQEGRYTSQFERSAGQTDKQIRISRENLGMRKKEFKVGMEDRTRAMGHEAAASGMFADLGEQMGMFQSPEVRARFEQLSPPDQQRAIGMFQEEEAKKVQQAQFQKLGTLLENAAANQLIDPAAAQAMLGQAEAAPEKMAEVYGQAQKLISDNAERNADMQQRQQGVEALGQMLPTLTNLSPKRHAAYLSMMQVDPDATYRDVLKMALAEDEQLEADRVAGEQLRMQAQQNAANLVTRFTQGAPIEDKAMAVANLRANKIPVDPDIGGGDPGAIIGEADKMALSELKARIGDAENDKERVSAQDAYEAEWQRLAKRPFPGRLGSVAKRLFPKVKPEKLTPEQKQKILDEANKGL